MRTAGGLRNGRKRSIAMADRRDRPPLPGILAPLGALSERAYLGAVRRRNGRFDRGDGVERFDVPVLSVGNLSVGGTGKTPMVSWIVSRLIDAGFRPAIALRGYRSGRHGLSDEESEYLARFPGMPVIAGVDRRAGIRTLLKSGAHVDCIVLDDGFQHRWVGRDLDIVLVDATRDPFSDRCLPAGWLREPVQSLSRADVVVITHCEMVGEGVVDRLASLCSGAAVGGLVVRARHGWDGIVVGETMHRVEWISGRRVLCACGIGHPGAFVAEAKRAGAVIVGEVIRPDHHDWTVGDAREVRSRAVDGDAEMVLTTAKDISKLAPFAAEVGVALGVARLSLGLGADEGSLWERILGVVGDRAGRRSELQGTLSS